MKFGEKIQRESDGVYRDFYMDYAFLKGFVKDEHVGYGLFLEAVRVEFKKVNAFVQTMQGHGSFTRSQLLMYILFNYMGFYKIFKKYDKVRSQNKKAEFFELVSRQAFYTHYRLQTQKFEHDIRLVVFGKGGTLLDNGRFWGGRVDRLLKNLDNVFPGLTAAAPGGQSIWDRLGYGAEVGAFSGGSVIVRGDADDIRNAICDYIINTRVLVECGSAADRAVVRGIVRQEWDEIVPTKDTIRQCGNVRSVFEMLAARGIRVAVCTADTRASAEKALRYVGVLVGSLARQTNRKILNGTVQRGRDEPFVMDCLVCGNDGIPNKPSPEPLLTICQRLKIVPSQAMMVGDTLADIHSGINARFSRTVAVTGRGGPSTGLADATHVVETIDELPVLFSAMDDAM